MKISFAICILATVGYAGAAEEESKAAVKVFIDSATGKTRQPTPADIEKLAGAARTRAEAKQSGQPQQLDIRYGAGGAVGVKLGPESLSYVVVSRKPDGKLSMDCVTGENAAKKAVASDK